MFRMEKSSLWSKYCGRLLVYQTLRPNRSSLVFNSDQSIRVACNAGQVSSWRSGTLFSRVITTLNFRKLKDLHEGEIKKGGGEEAGREKRTSPSLRSRFLTLTPTLLVATSTLLKSSSVFRITVGSLCTDAPLALRGEGRGGEGCFCTQDKSWRRQLRSPQEYAYAEGYHKRPFSSWNGSRRKYWPKGKYQGKKQADISHIYITHRKQIYSSVPSYGNNISATKEDKDYFSNGDVTRDDS